jgi:hypothetical protein
MAARKLPRWMPELVLVVAVVGVTVALCGLLARLFDIELPATMIGFLIGAATSVYRNRDIYRRYSDPNSTELRSVNTASLIRGASKRQR